MAKKFGSGICAHCGKYFKELTSDHIFPKAWYPDSTPVGIEKWQMPSCFDCNQKYSKIENDLLVRFSLGLAPNDINSLGLVDKGLRAVSPQYGKNQKDTDQRKKKREKLLKNVEEASKFDDNSFLTGMDNTFGLSKEQLLAVKIPANYIDSLGEKIVRGMTYVTKGKILDDSYEIKIIVTRSGFNAPILDLMRKNSFTYERGPGILVAIATPADNQDVGFFEVTIWGKIHFYGVVLPKNR